MKNLLFIPIILLMVLNLGCEKKEPQMEKNRFQIDGRVAFVSSRSHSSYSATIYENGKFTIVNEEGGGTPKFSPDGRKLLRSRAIGLEIVNLQTDEREIIKEPNGVEISNFYWLPDYSGIISRGYLGRSGIGKPNDIYIYSFQNKKWKNLTNYVGDNGINGFDIFQDGKNIICSYSSNWAKHENKGTYIMNLETLEKRKIADWGGKYRIFPDQKRVAVERGIETEKELITFSEISVFNLETGEEKFYTRDGAPKSRPTVSPDGKKILYSATTNIGSRIFMVDLETGQKREMFDRKPYYNNEPSTDRHPDWAWA